MTQLRSKSTFLGVALAAVVLSPLAASAASDTDNTTLTASVGSTISMTTSGTLSIPVAPGASAVETVRDDVVTVNTNNLAGYTLDLKDSDATLTLTKGSDTIAAHAGTTGTPTALATNSWGWRVDDGGADFPLNAFGAGPTSDTTDSTSSTGNYAGIAATDATIRSTSSTATNEVTNVWYGVKVDSSKPNGNYTNTVTYTATTK